MGYYAWQAHESNCVICSRSLSGRQERYCSNACRQAHKRLSALTDDADMGKRTCDFCDRDFWPETTRQRYCCADCSALAKDEAVKEREEATCQLEGCEENAGWDGVGRARKYCCPAHRTKAYRLRKAAESASAGR